MAFIDELKAERSRLAALLDPHRGSRIKAAAEKYRQAVGSDPPEAAEILQSAAQSQESVAQRIAMIDELLEAPATITRLAGELRLLTARLGSAQGTPHDTGEVESVTKAIQETRVRYIRARSLAVSVKLQDLKAAYEPVLAEWLAIQEMSGQPSEGGVYSLQVDPLAIQAAKLLIASELQGADSSAYHAPAPGTLVN